MLWRNRVKIDNWDRADFVFEVAGLRENYPRLEIGDLSHFREVLEDQKEGSGKMFEGRISTFQKRKGLVCGSTCSKGRREILINSGSLFFFRRALSCPQTAYHGILQRKCFPGQTSGTS